MIKLALEGLLTLVITFVFSLIFGALICFLWPVITIAIPGLDGTIASELTYIDSVGLSFLLSVLVGSTK